MSVGLLGLFDFTGIPVGIPAPVVSDAPCVSVVDWGSAYLELAYDTEFADGWRELEGNTFGACDVSTITLTIPTTRHAAQVSVTVQHALLRQTHQQMAFGSEEDVDGFHLVAHVWSANLSGLVPKKGMRLNDCSNTYEVKEVSHDNRRQRFKLTCLRER